MASAAALLTNPALWQYLTSIGVGGTYVMNKDNIDRFAGSLFKPSGYQTDAEFLAGSSDDFAIPWNELGVNRQNYLLNEGAIEREEFEWGPGGQPLASNVRPISISAAPGATDSEFDAKKIVYPAGALVHQPAGALVGGGNGGNGGDNDKRYWQNARWSAIGELVDKFTRGFDGEDEVDPYEAGEIEREENEWGPGGQPSASEQTRIYEQSGWRNSPRYRNSPAARSGVFTEEELGRQKQLHDDFKEAQRSGTMEEFVRQYPQSQTAKEYAIRRRIPSSLDMEF